MRCGWCAYVAAVAAAWLAAAITEAQDTSVVVRIDQGEVSPTGPLLDEKTLSALLKSASIKDAAIEAHANEIQSLVESGERAIWLNFEPLSGGPSWLIGQVTLTLSETPAEAKPVARALLETVMRRFQLAVRKSSELEQARLYERVGHATDYFQRAEQDLKTLQYEQQDLLKAAGRYQLRREPLLQEMRNLQRQREELERDMVGRRARREALAEQIAKTAQAVQEQSGRNPIVAELSRIVELRERELQRIRQLYEKSAASTDDMAAAEEPLAHARAEVARAREEAAHMAGGGQLDDLNGQLINMTIEMAELEAKLQFVSRQLAQMEEGDLPRLADEYERLELQIDRARRVFEDAIHARDEAQMRLQSYQPPRVTVLGAEEASGGD